GQLGGAEDRARGADGDDDVAGGHPEPECPASLSPAPGPTRRPSVVRPAGSWSPRTRGRMIAEAAARSMVVSEASPGTPSRPSSAAGPPSPVGPPRASRAADPNAVRNRSRS